MLNLVKISDAIDSDSSVVAASSLAVKTVYDLISSARANLVSAPEITSTGTNLVAGYSTSVTASSAAYLAGASVAEIKATFSFNNIEYTYSTSSIADGSGTISVKAPAGSGGQSIAVSFVAYDNLGNASQPTIKTYTVIDASVNTPKVTAPSASAIVHPKSFTLTTSAFASTGYSDTLKSVEWKVTSDSAGSTSIGTGSLSSASGTVSLSTAMTPGSSYYVFVRHQGTTLGYSAWSAGVKITASKVNTPTLTSPTAGAEVIVAQGLTVTTSAFSCTGGISDTHVSTDWKITSDSAGNSIISEKSADSGLTSATFNDLKISDGDTYYAWARHNSENCGSSNWVSVSFIGKTQVLSPSGRAYYRHSSGMGTVLEFNDGSARKVLVLDAKYRGSGIMCDNYTDTSLPNYSTSNTNGCWDIDGDNDYDANSNHPQMTDAELNSLWANSIDSNTGKYNTDIWLTQTNPEAANLCRAVKVDGTGCDIPNIQTLMRIFCEANLLDSMDPTVSDYPTNALGDANSNGWWRIAGSDYCWSSTEVNGSYCRGVYYDGYCSGRSKDVSDGVVPVLEI